MKRMCIFQVETLGYYQESLRDEDEILVALDFQSADRSRVVAIADWKSAIQQVGNLRYVCLASG